MYFIFLIYLLVYTPGQTQRSLAQLHTEQAYQIISDPACVLYDYFKDCVLDCLHVKQIQRSLLSFQSPLDLWTVTLQEMLSLPCV